MTIQEKLKNLKRDSKNQTKDLNFQYGNNDISFSNDTLNIYDYDKQNSQLLKGDLNLNQFPNLRKITFAYNLRVNLLESIDISENIKLNRIVIGQNSQTNPFQNSNCCLLAKERQLNQVIVTYFTQKTQYVYQYGQQTWWVEKNQHLKNQSGIPFSLIEDRKLEQLEAENEQLRQQIIDKDRQIAELKKETKQTPTLRQFQELNNIALPTTELNFDNLKREVQRLKLKDFNPYFQEQKDKLNQAIDVAKKAVGDNLEMFLELCLQTQKQISEQEESSNDLIQAQLKGQLIAYQTILQTKLDKEKVKRLLDKRAEFTQLEKQLNILQQIQEGQVGAKIEIPNKSSYR